MAKSSKIDRTKLDRYESERARTMKQTVSFTNRGSVTIAVDMMADWPADQLYAVLYAGPGGQKLRTHLYIEPAGPDDRGSIKMGYEGNGAGKLNARAAFSMLGLDDFDGGRRCPARWEDGLIVASIEDATLKPRRRPPAPAARPPAESGPKCVGKKSMLCPDCGKEVPYLMMGGSRITRAHRDPDGVPCGGAND